MTIMYSTSDVNPDEALAYWLEVVTDGFLRYLLPADDGNPFKASMSVGNVGYLQVSTYEASPHMVGRTANEICRGDTDHYLICLVQQGSAVHREHDREARVESGNFFVLDPGTPFEGHMQKAGRILSIRVPRREFEARFSEARNLTTRTFDGKGAITSMMLGFLSMLPARADRLSGVAATKIADQSLDLFCLAVTNKLQSADASAATSRATSLMVLKMAIEARLRDPGFKPAAAAAAAGISVRYANALLAQEDTGLERYIIERRLEQCRKALLDPAQAHRPIGEIAFSWGFGDVSHFNRRFKAAYGCAPGEYRRMPQLTAYAST